MQKNLTCRDLELYLCTVYGLGIWTKAEIKLQTEFATNGMQLKRNMYLSFNQKYKQDVCYWYFVGTKYEQTHKVCWVW